MYQIADRSQKGSSPYTAVITREQFLFYEMRITARLVAEGLTVEQVVARITSDNLFQYPTERTVRRMQDCVTDDYGSVQYWIGNGDFNEDPLPKSVDEYLLWIDRQLVFLEKRNKRISDEFM